MSRRLSHWIAVALVLTLAGAFVPPASAHPMPAETAHKERYFAKRCNERSRKGIFACIHRAAFHWKQSYSYMKQLAWCESKWNPNVDNYEGSGAAGLFQFMPRTWASTPYGRYSVYDAKYNSLAAAWGLGNGVTWSCA